MSGAVHIPVLCDEVVGALNIASGKTFIDGTFGVGGYTSAILKAADCRIALDRDPDAIKRGSTKRSFWRPPDTSTGAVRRNGSAGAQGRHRDGRRHWP